MLLMFLREVTVIQEEFKDLLVLALVNHEGLNRYLRLQIRYMAWERIEFGE